jgi:hypothetical protein
MPRPRRSTFGSASACLGSSGDRWDTTIAVTAVESLFWGLADAIQAKHCEADCEPSYTLHMASTMRGCGASTASPSDSKSRPKPLPFKSVSEKGRDRERGRVGPRLPPTNARTCVLPDTCGINGGFPWQWVWLNRPNVFRVRAGVCTTILVHRVASPVLVTCGVTRVTPYHCHWRSACTCLHRRATPQGMWPLPLPALTDDLLTYARQPRALQMHA